MGDYTARHRDGKMDTTVIERKGVGDLFNSFTHEYENEKAKILRAKEAGLHYVLAVESTPLGIRAGYKFSKKDGLSQVRQIMTISRKYGVEVWWCANREEMAFQIQEYFLVRDRMLAK